jgi:transposase-like protein
MPRREYTPDERTTALAALAANAGNVEATARALGMPARTLRSWVRGERTPPMPAEDVPPKKADLAARFEQIAWRCLSSVTPEKLAAAPVNHLMTAAGIATDKMRLLRGEPTAIAEHGVALDFRKLTDEQLRQWEEILRVGAADPAVLAGSVPPGPAEVRPPVPDQGPGPRGLAAV